MLGLQKPLVSVHNSCCNAHSTSFSSSCQENNGFSIWNQFIFLICNQSFKCQCSLLAFWLDTKNHRHFVENSPDPECSFLQWTYSTPWTIPSSVSLNAASLEPKPEKPSDLWGEVTDSKRHHCSSKGYTTECRCTAEHDVAPVSHRLGNNQPHMV